ncbi:MAG TPA: fused MFS/spermidine synthase [Planosporangium sp.]|nr:fused MFS/spermidine synthase [Planosporangium sp.]
MKASRRGPASIVEPVDLGTAALVPDRDRPEGWTLLVDGVAQSHVDLGDPTYLEFEYMRKLASVADAAAPPGSPLRVLHLGGGALALPRYVEATRPRSRQRVVERDAALIALVRRVLPLPRGADLRVRVADARAAVESTRDAAFDLIIADVYRGAQMPRTVSSVEFAAQVARILRPGGLYAVNVADMPPLAFSRIQAATLRAAFADVCVMAEAGTLRGRRYGNVVLAAAARPDGLPVDQLAAATRRDAFPSRLLHADELDRFIAGARPMTDSAAEDSPKPPPGLLT